MAFQQGDRYGCPDPECGCEIQVTKGAAPGKRMAWSFVTPPGSDVSVSG